MTTLPPCSWSLLLLTSMLAGGRGGQPDRPAKLEGELARRIATAAADELLPVDILLAAQADRARIQALGLLPDKRERRALVRQLLEDVAAGTQAELLAWLEEQRQAGQVGERIDRLWIHNVVSARVTPAVALELAARADVALVHYDPPRGEEVLAAAPLPTAGGSPTCGLDLIRAPQAWAQTGITGQGVVVGLIDSGLCPTHPDIAGQIWTNPCEIAGNGIDDDQNGFVDDVHGWNFESNSNDTSDGLGHGSHVAGTLAGNGAQGTQCGVAPDARIMVLKFWSNLAGEQSVWSSIQYGVANGADILNASLGWRHANNPQRATWRAVCENAIAAGVVVVCAAGGEGCGTSFDNVHTPGDVPAVLTVGAVGCNDTIAAFSSCGPVTWQSVPPYNDCPYPPGCIKPDVSAPGVGTVSHDLCGGYTSYDGTSMATPHVAGLAALLLQADPTLDHFGVQAILEGTAVDRGLAGKDNQYGAGRIDALAAVQAALANGNYCTAKSTSCGTTPTITASGRSSATAPSGFVVSATGMRARQVGMLVYTDAGPNNAPFLGGHLCIQGIHRTVLVHDTIGTPGLCDGELALDMNSYRSGALGGPPPLPALSQPGSTIHCQFFGRDPGNSFNASLTGGYEFVVCP